MQPQRSFARSWRRIAAMARKEVRQLARDRLTLAMMIGIPALQLLLFGYAIDLDVRHIETALLDRDRSALSRDLVAQLVATQAFEVTHTARTEAEATALLARGAVQSVIVIPPDLERRLYRGRGAELSILVDGSNPAVVAAAAQAGQGLEAALSRRIGSEPGQAQPPIGQRIASHRLPIAVSGDMLRPEALRIAVLPLYNPERRTAVFIVPGLIGTILTMTMMLMTAVAVVRERERGTLEYLIATPVRRGEVMIGKLAPYVLVGHAQIALVLGLGVWMFDMPVHGSLVDLTIASAPFIAAMLATGLLISTRARSQFQAMQMAFFFFLPSMLLSGFMFPFEAMPRAAQWLGEVLPLTHYLRLVRGILLRGASLGDLARELLPILAFATGALALSAAGFRKRLG
jgi:ABC-2 type transport system permease protein